MRHTVFVDGQEGTTGLRIHEYLARRSDVEVMQIDPDRRKDATERARLINASTVTFLCLPDGAAREAAALVTNPATCLIDASTAHRTAPGWVYGLPELTAGQRAAVQASRRISNPGCHATAFILLIRPLVDAGLLEASQVLSAASVTGYSGGGKKMIEQYERLPQEQALTSPRLYGLGLSHKHVPEMTVHGGLSAPPIFLPSVGPFYKGLAVSVPLVLAAKLTAEAVHQAWSDRYAGEPFVRVMPMRDVDVLNDGYFDIQASNDTNRTDLFVFSNASQAVLIARLDNLGKGASGAAVQSMNIVLGVEERLGL